MHAYLTDFKFLRLTRNSFALFFRNFFALAGALFVVAGIITIVFGIPAILSLAGSQGTSDAPISFVVMFYLFIAAIVSVPGYMLVVETSELCLGGRTSFRHALSALSLIGILRYLFAAAFQSLVIFSPFGIAYAIDEAWNVFMLGKSQDTLSPFLLVASIIVSLLLFVRLQFVTQAVVLEKRGTIGSIARSWEISKRFGRQIFFFQLGFGLIVVVAIYLVALVLVPFFVLVPDNPTTPVAVGFAIIFFCYYAVATVMIAALPLIFHTLMYYCIRVAKHDLSMEDLVDMQVYRGMQ